MWIYVWILLGSFASGFISGGWSVYTLWNVSHKNQIIADLKTDNKNFRAAAGIAADLDEESEEAREKNASIVRKIYELESRPPEVKMETQYVIKPEIIYIEGKSGTKRPIALKKGTGRPVCIDADSMRFIGSIQ